MVHCIIPKCKNFTGRQGNYPKVKYFRFPKNEKILDKWVAACRRNGKFSIKNARVCSDHFTEDDWRLQDILMNVPKKSRKLKKDAIPSKNLSIELSTSMEQQEKTKIRKIRALVQDETNRLDLIEQEIDSNKRTVNYKRHNIYKKITPLKKQLLETFDEKTFDIDQKIDLTGSVLHEEEIEFALNKVVDRNPISNSKNDVQSQTEYNYELIDKLRIIELEEKFQALQRKYEETLKNLEEAKYLSTTVIPKKEFVTLKNSTSARVGSSKNISTATYLYTASQTEFETIWF